MGDILLLSWMYARTHDDARVDLEVGSVSKKPKKKTKKKKKKKKNRLPKNEQKKFKKN